jgi:hypothetical protein
MVARAQRLTQRKAVLGTKRKALSERAGAWKAFYEAEAEHSWQHGASTITCYDFDASDNRVHFWVRVTRDDGRVVFEDDHVVVNPPAGGDVRQSLREIVEGSMP